MKRLTALLLAIHIGFVSAFAQAPAVQTPAPQGPQKFIIQTPFGPKEVEVAPGQPPPPDSVPVSPQATPVVAPPAQTPPATPAAAAPAPAPPSAGSQPQQQAASDQPANVALRFDNGDIYSIIKIICDSLNLSYVIDPGVKGTVNVTTNANVRQSDLLPILETVLRLNGATMTKNGNFYLIVPANAAAHQSLPVEQQNPPATSPDDQMVLQIIRMKFVQASEMKNLLTPYLTEGATIAVMDTGGILLVTELKSNLRKLLELVDTFDSNAFEGERVRIFPVKQSLAKDLIEDLRKIFAGYALSENTAIRFVPIDRLNSLLVITPTPSVFPEVEKWIDRLDQKMATDTAATTRTFIYHVKNAKASDLQRVLSQLYGTTVQLSSIYQTPGNAGPLTPAAPNANPASPTAAGPVSAPGGQAGSAMAGSGATAVVPFGGVRIVADEINNVLLVQTTPLMWADVERTLNDLDHLKRQVLIDAQVYEVTLSDSLSLGLSAILQARGTLTSNTASFAGAPPSLTGQAAFYVSRTKELAAFLNASENRSRVRTLSSPSVVVADNLTATFQVGSEVPVPTSSSVTPVQSGGSSLFAQTIQYRPTGVLLTVKPQVNPSGNVTLEVTQEISDAAVNTTSSVAAPVIGISSVNSTVVVQDGQTLAISGFIRENNELDRSRIPLIGRIPGLGVLLGNTDKTSSRTELIVLMTPHVLQTYNDADLATDELKAKLKEVQKLLK
jgi:general secretion pathway protein D